MICGRVATSNFIIDDAVDKEKVSARSNDILDLKNHCGYNCILLEERDIKLCVIEIRTFETNLQIGKKVTIFNFEFSSDTRIATINPYTPPPSGKVFFNYLQG